VSKEVEPSFSNTNRITQRGPAQRKRILCFGRFLINRPQKPVGSSLIGQRHSHAGRRIGNVHRLDPALVMLHAALGHLTGLPRRSGRSICHEALQLGELVTISLDKSALGQARSRLGQIGSALTKVDFARQPAMRSNPLGLRSQLLGKVTFSSASTTACAPGASATRRSVLPEEFRIGETLRQETSWLPARSWPRVGGLGIWRTVMKRTMWSCLS